jgi:hypothetical protein
MDGRVRAGNDGLAEWNPLAPWPVISAMRAKPILLWPKARSDIETCLDRAADDFTVVDTNRSYELQKLHGISARTPIFDPFPGYGERYREFESHVSARGCELHIAGLEPCRRVLDALKDPALARASIEELYGAVMTTVDAQASASRLWPFAGRPWLDWLNTIVPVTLVFLAVLIGNVLVSNGGVTAAFAATAIFTVAYACIRVMARRLPAWRR